MLLNSAAAISQELRRIAVMALILICCQDVALAQTNHLNYPSNLNSSAGKPSASLCAELADRISAGRTDVLFDGKGKDSNLSRPIDLNGDGRAELVHYDGWNGLVVSHGNGSTIAQRSPRTGYDDEAFWGDHPSLIRHDGAVYVMTKGGTLSSVFYFDEDLQLRLACVFRQGKKRLRTLSAYEIFVARSKAKNIDPILLAVRHQDTDALRLLVNNGHDLNANRGPDHASYLAEAVSALSSKPDAETFISTMLDLGASPGAESDSNSQSPIHMAVFRENARLVKLLIDRGAYISSAYHNPNSEITDLFSDRPTREDLLLTVTRRRGVIDVYALSYAVGDRASGEFLRELVDTKLALEGNVVWRANGQVVANDPMMIEKVAAKKEPGEALRLLARLRRNAPQIGTTVSLYFWYEGGARVVLINSVPVDSPTPPYSKAYEKEFMNFATSLCMHLVGGACGSAEAKREAQEWQDALPINCTAELSESFDQPVCKLALYWIKQPNYVIYLRDMTKPGTRKTRDSVLSIRAFSELGRRSLLQ